MALFSWSGTGSRGALSGGSSLLLGLPQPRTGGTWEDPSNPVCRADDSSSPWKCCLYISTNLVLAHDLTLITEVHFFYPEISKLSLHPRN